MDVFMKKINEVYDIKNNDKKTIDILKYLNRDLILLNKMQKIENKKYKEDPYILSHGFVIDNNNEKFNIILKEIIVRDSFSMIFSFCYSPDKKEINHDEPANKKNKNPNACKIPIVDMIVRLRIRKLVHIAASQTMFSLVVTNILWIG